MYQLKIQSIVHQLKFDLCELYACVHDRCVWSAWPSATPLLGESALQLYLYLYLYL